MSLKKYILPLGEVSSVAEAASLQEASIKLEKDPQSSFYIAHLDDQISLPENLHILEIKESKISPANEDKSGDDKNAALAPQGDGNMLDLHLRFHLPPGLDRSYFETALHSKISQAIEAIINEGDSSEQE
ncbi:hypothetical protein PQO03_19370 [Lentisphaera profundi]|uniref:Uncharacterized protein n=1 Tax=Lentisphaera profundi TaxID=1658616 RepID=A0ABY7VYX9_9BACT|nr:hypothetical protein [Lentisphaera profundi]WDE97991.1 hypothetical protein PQO03_19370 [Lentisphaera profundi]